MKKPMMLNAIQKVKMAMKKPMMAMKKPLASKDPKNFGMLSVKAGIDNNPNPTKADRIAGATMKKRKPKMAMKKPRLTGSKEKQKSTDVGGVFSEYKDKKITFDNDKITKKKYKETTVGGKKKIKVKKKVTSTLSRKQRKNKDGSVTRKRNKKVVRDDPNTPQSESQKKAKMAMKKKPKMAMKKKPKMAMKKKPKMAMKKKPKMMKKVPKGNMTLPKLSERKKKRIDKRVNRKTKAAVRKIFKRNDKTDTRRKLAKSLLDKYGRKDYDRIRKDASFVASLPASDRGKVKTINALKKSEVRKDKAIKRKGKKIDKLEAKLR